MNQNFIAKAPEPSRASGSITLTWGMLSVPLSIYTGTEETTLGRKEFVNGDTSRPAGRAVIDKSTGEQLKDGEEIIRMAESSDGHFVELSDDEVAACTGDRGIAKIVTFMPLVEMERYVPSKVMQVRPKRVKKVPDPAGAKVFTLLLSAMASKNLCVLVQVALRGPAQYGVLTPTGDLLFVHPTDGVRKPLPLGLVSVTSEEMQAANDLIDNIGVTLAPEILDETSAKVQAYVNKKAAAGSSWAPPSTPPLPDPSAVDVLSTLLASIDEDKSFAPPSGLPLAAPDKS